MPIQDTSGQAGASSSPYGSDPAGTPIGVAAAPSVAQTTAPVAQGWSFLGSGSLGGVSRLATSEALVKAQAKFNEYYTKKQPLDKPLEITVHPVDNTKETRLDLSSVVVAVRNTEAKELGVSYHTLLLEASGEPMQAKIENWNGQQIPVDRVPGDVMDPTYGMTVKQIMQRAFPGQEVRPISAEVVPRSFNWEDDEALRNLAVNAIYPCLTDLEQHHPSFQDINLRTREKGEMLQVGLNFNEPDRTDYSGLPVRNDIVISLTAVSPQKTTNEINAQERTKRVALAGGFIDLLWAPVQQQVNPYNQYGQVQQGPNYKFSPRFVMTNCENVMRMTVASQLLALVTTLALRENNNWFPYFQPRPSAGGRAIDLKDIGAINYEANIFGDAGGYGQRIDTKGGSFTNQNLGQLLSQTVRPELIYSLDVSECGSDTWYNEIFAAAAAGSGGASNEILRAANTLTGGLFEQYYKSSDAPVIQNDERIHLGYYIGSNGEKRDIREIDYLAVLNLQGGNDVGAVQAWSDTFLRLEYPLSKRLAERKKMIIELSRADITFTGFARRVTFMGHFLEALAAACREAGLDTRVISSSFGGDYISQRAAAGFVPNAAVPMGQSGLFSMGMGGGGGAYTASGQRGFSRWG